VTDEFVLRVSEVFASIQGEGPNAGKPCVFLRLAVCNLRCVWCDTPYSWDWSRYDYSREVAELTVAEVAQRLRQARRERLIVTGGEPMLQQEGLIALFERLDPGCFVEVETNGTLPVNARLLDRVGQWNVSPKLENSGEPRSRRIHPEVLAALRDTGKAWLKCVIEAPAQVDEVEALVEEIAWPRSHVLLMPQSANREELRLRAPGIEDVARRRGFGVSPRLHLEMFDGRRGV
jgi:organic radical activating enzyme